MTIIQQYISGGNLHELLREKEQPIPLAQRLGIALGAHFAVLSQCTVAHWVVGVLVLFSVYSRLAWRDLRDQGKEMILRELDLRYEEYSLRSLKKKLRRQKIYVPDTFRKYSSRRVLVMEFIHAALMSDYVDLEKSDPQRLQRWLTENNIKPKQVARKLLFSVIFVLH